VSRKKDFFLYKIGKLKVLRSVKSIYNSIMVSYCSLLYIFGYTSIISSRLVYIKTFSLCINTIQYHATFYFFLSLIIITWYPELDFFSSP